MIWPCTAWSAVRTISARVKLLIWARAPRPSPATRSAADPRKGSFFMGSKGGPGPEDGRGGMPRVMPMNRSPRSPARTPRAALLRARRRQVPEELSQLRHDPGVPRIVGQVPGLARIGGVVEQDLPGHPDPLAVTP